MPRLVTHALRLLRRFARNPGQFLRASRRLPDHLDARDFAQGFLVASPAGAAPSTNPLLEYFDRHTEGRGLWKWRRYFDVYHLVYSIHCYPFITVVERTDHATGTFVSEPHGTEWQPSLVVSPGYGKLAGRGA